LSRLWSGARRHDRAHIIALAAIAFGALCSPAAALAAQSGEPAAPTEEPAAQQPAPTPTQAAPKPAPAAKPWITAAQAKGEIRIDGRLDEPDWRTAAVIPDLVQKDPHPGEPTPYRTEVRILVDRENLYFGITCIDPHPDRIAMHTMQRDTADPFGDDFVDLIFDTFGDHHTAFLFEIYPTGAQADGLVSGPNQLSMDWDGVWETRVSVTAEGWVAEVRIPSRTLHFKSGVDSWGFNVLRHVALERMYVVWSGTTIDSDMLDLGRAGVLSGVGGLDQGMGLTVSPYLLGRLDRTFAEPDQQIVGQGGLDLSFSLTPGLPAVATFNTDFAETEVDSRQINLSRFSLFFPEKRPFFLEGSNQFGFGSGLGTDFIPFYSRRLGLATSDCSGSSENTSADRIPIDWGAKILGHAGRFGIAALDIQTGTSEFAPRTNLFAGRLTYDATEHLRLGTLATNGCPDGITRNRFGGLDLVWHTSNAFGGKNMTVGGWAARSGGDLPQGRKDGWGARIDYPNDHWNGYLDFKQLGDALQPALGFLPRPGTRQYQAGQAFQPRPSRDGPFRWARQFFFETFYTQVDDLEGTTQSRQLFTAPFNVDMRGGEHFELNWIPQFERLTAPFEVVPGVFIPPGDYHFTRYRAEVESSRTRPWRIGSTVYWGDFYDGRLTQIQTFVDWNVLKGHWQQRLDLQNDFGRMPEGNFAQRLWQLQNVFAFSPRLILSSFFQYDTDSHSLGMNTRLRYTFHPGNDLFVVWNRNWQHPLAAPAFSIEPDSDQVTVKVRVVWSG
jgi:uncharacterized protein DUF5916